MKPLNDLFLLGTTLQDNIFVLLCETNSPDQHNLSTLSQ